MKTNQNKPTTNPIQIQNVKLVVMGDSGVGKTAVIVSYHEDGLPNQHLPHVYDNVVAQIRKNNIDIHLGLWDVSGHAEYDRLRPLSYPRTDVFLLMYDIANKESFLNLRNKWCVEKQHHVPDAAFGIVGCKKDLRKLMETAPVNDEMNENILLLVICHWLHECNINMQKMDKSVLDMIVSYSQCLRSRKDYVRYEDGEHMAMQLGACGYMECSALSREGLEELFEAACEWAMRKEDSATIFRKQYDKKYKNKKDCVIL